MSKRYGTDVRPWPKHGLGYWASYEHILANVFGTAATPWGDGTKEPWYLTVAPGGDIGEVWDWCFGYFSWTPDGDYWTPVQYGTNPTRARAEAECRRAAENYTARTRKTYA